MTTDNVLSIVCGQLTEGKGQFACSWEEGEGDK